MTNVHLGKLTRLDPRSVWQHEAQEFTPWLAENLTLLNQALGLEIELNEREKRVGDFAVDIYGSEVGSGREVIIENQLASTDHAHLGQLMTYAAGLDAKIVIWISPQFRDEHEQAIDWLNRRSVGEVSFFGVELEILQIDDSPPAPNFNVVAQPSEWVEHISAETKAGRSERQIAYHEFFADFVSHIKDRSPGFTNIRRVGYDSWIHFATGRSGFAFSVSFVTGRRFRVELEIDTGDYDVNRLAFRQLQGDKDNVERELGHTLEWDLVERRRACRVYVSREGTVDSPDETLQALKGWALDGLLRFNEVFAPRLKALNLEAPVEA